MSLQPGSALGNYLIVERIGRGGMATVYKAFQPSQNRYVAIKVLPAFFAEDEEVRRRFEHESLAVINLRHPNILTAYEYGEHDGVVFLVSELVDGGSLAEMVGTPRAPALVARLLAPIASALDYAHDLGVLHRDVKPTNILLRRDGTPVLSDFGLVRLLHGATRLTRTGMTVGTPEYMAPEQGASEAAGPAADNYALAVVAYELLTGRVPFRGETPVAILLAHMQQPVTLVSTLNPALPATLDAVMAIGLAKEPGARFADAAAFIEALEAAGQGKAVQSIRVPAGAAPVVAGALAGRAAPGSPRPAPTLAPVVAGRRGPAALPWLAAVLLAALAILFWVLTRGTPTPSAHSAKGGQPAAPRAVLSGRPTPRGHAAGGRAIPGTPSARPTAIVAARVAAPTSTATHEPTATAPLTATPAPTHTATSLPTRTATPAPSHTPNTLPASDSGLPIVPATPTATAWAAKAREPESSPPPSDLRTQGAPPTATTVPATVPPTPVFQATPIVGHHLAPRKQRGTPRPTPRPTARVKTGLAGHVVLLPPTPTPVTR